MSELRAYAPPVLIVDDSSEDLTLLERALHQCKILNPIVPCRSGDECLAALESRSKENFPVLILLDLIMAPTAGLDVLQAMHKDGSIKQIPVVMLSGIRDIHAVREGYQLGAQTFLVKPVTVEDILQMVSTVSRICVEEVPGGYVLNRAVCPPGEQRGDTAFLLKKRVAAFPA